MLKKSTWMAIGTAVLLTGAAVAAQVNNKAASAPAASQQGPTRQQAIARLKEQLARLEKMSDQDFTAMIAQRRIRAQQAAVARSASPAAGEKKK